MGIDWPTVDRSGSPSNVILSEKDTAAPSLAEGGSGADTPRIRHGKDVDRWPSLEFGMP
ncbi:hypothetical protein [Rhodococcus opacus]|uniref:hypothetical protein n=1 Tax=Rhodococcus opacus TaxID=37919 RepID=UPI002474B79A|nr:hypothetical protein [Rhodococcus opacus]